MKNLSIIILIIFTIHNLEEAIWLTNWSEKHSPQKNKTSQKEFLFSVSIITLIGYFIYFLHQFQSTTFTTNILYGFLGAMILNVIFPHIALSVLTKSYMPGVGTGVGLIIPFYLYLISIAIKNGSINIQSFLIATGLTSLALICLLFLLNRIASKMFPK